MMISEIVQKYDLRVKKFQYRATMIEVEHNLSFTHSIIQVEN